MESKEEKNIIFLRMFSDEDINEKLKEVCKLYNVKTAVILSGIGQIKKVKLGYFKKKGNYSPEIFDNPLEILSLSGNIIKEENDYNLHIHITLGNEKKNVIGGHFIEATVGITAEIVLLKLNIDAKRILDENTDLKGLFLS